MVSAFAASLPLTFRPAALPRTSYARPSCFSSPSMSINTIVTGAAGRTGRLVLSRLVERPEFTARGLVRDVARAEGALADAGLGDCGGALVQGDVRDRDSLREAFKGMDALIVLSSAVPQMRPPVEGQPPVFYYHEGCEPAAVDGDGGVNQVEVAKELGMRVVWVGSMVRFFVLFAVVASCALLRVAFWVGMLSRRRIAMGEGSCG